MKERLDYQTLITERPNIHRLAAHKANRIVGHQATPDDIDDMAQEAHLRIWEIAPKAPSTGYLVNTGTIAALQWWRYYALQVKAYEDGQRGGLQTVSLDESDDDWHCDYHEITSLVTGEPTEDEPGPLTEERIQLVWHWLSQYRPNSTERVRRRAIAILDLLCRGYTTAAIAVELGLKENTVYSTRKFLRNALDQVATALTPTCDTPQTQALGAV